MVKAKKTEIKKPEVKTAAKDSLSALLTNTKDSASTKKGNNPLLDKIIGQGGGPVLGLFMPKDTAVVGGAAGGVSRLVPPPPHAWHTESRRGGALTYRH